MGLKLVCASSWYPLRVPNSPPLMAEKAAEATDLVALDAQSHDLKRQLQQLKGQKKGQERKKARTAKTLFQVALCLLALSGSRTEVVVQYWRRCGEDLDTAERKTDELVNHFLAIEPVAVAAILDAKSGPEGVALKKAVSFLLAQETLSWVREQNEGKGIAPPRQYVLQAREKLRLRMRKEANASVSSRLKLKTKAAAYKWAQRWRHAWHVASGAFQARKVLTPASMRRKAWKLRRVASRSFVITAPTCFLRLPPSQWPHVKDATWAVLRV